MNGTLGWFTFKSPNIQREVKFLFCIINLKNHKMSPCFNRCDFGCVLEAHTGGHCLCGSWRTAQALRSCVDCGIQPANQNLKGTGNSSHFPFMGWRTGTHLFDCITLHVRTKFIKLHGSLKRSHNEGSTERLLLPLSTSHEFRFFNIYIPFSGKHLLPTPQN